MESKLKDKYDGEVEDLLMDTFEYKNVMRVPKLRRTIINVGVGEAKENPKTSESAVKDLRAITGRAPLVTQTKKSIANLKLRGGQKIGCEVTLRGQKMYDFLDKLINVALPRVRGFRGVSKTAFDSRGSRSSGIKEQLIFPEIEYDKVDALRGMNVVIVTTAGTDERAKVFLEKIGMPLTKE